MSSSGIAGQRRADHVRVEVALAAEAVVRVELRHRDVQEASRSASSEPCTSPSSTPTRRSPRPVAQHALEQRRLARARGAHHVDHRHAVAVEVVAVGPRDRVVGVERVLDDPDLHAMHRRLLVLGHLDRLHLELLARDDLDRGGAAGRAAEHRELDLPLARARPRSAAAPGRPPARAPRRRTASRARARRTRRRARRARPAAAARSARSRPSTGRPPACRTAVATTAEAIENSCISARTPRPCAARRSSRRRARARAPPPPRPAA